MVSKGSQCGIKVGIRLAHFLNRVDGVHNGRVVFGKNPADLGKTQFKDLSDEIHGNLSRERDRATVGATLEIGDTNPIMLGDKTDDVGW